MILNKNVSVQTFGIAWFANWSCSFLGSKVWYSNLVYRQAKKWIAENTLKTFWACFRLDMVCCSSRKRKILIKSKNHNVQIQKMKRSFTNICMFYRTNKRLQMWFCNYCISRTCAPDLMFGSQFCFNRYLLFCIEFVGAHLLILHAKYSSNIRKRLLDDLVWNKLRIWLLILYCFWQPRLLLT